MRCGLLPAGFAMLLGIGLVGAEQEKKRDDGIGELVGTWVMMDGPGGCTVEFAKDGKITWHSVGPWEVLVNGTYKVDATKNPKEIEISWGTRREPAALGIYKVEGDRLTLLMDRERPKTFDAKPQTNLVLQKKAK
jgi:uncharacterized protein (TIGR03066 family)